MAKNFYFKTINIKNFRGLKSLNIDNLRRINFIGGMNGAGKTTLLDAIFLILGRNNPTIMSRPFQLRQTNMPFPDGLAYLFSDQKIESSIEMSFDTRQGKLKATLSNEKNREFQTSLSNNIFDQHSKTTTSQTSNVSIKLTLSIEEERKPVINDVLFFEQPTPDQISLQIKNNPAFQTPIGGYISSLTGVGPIEDAQRFSVIVKKNEISRLIGFLQKINPEVESIKLLQDHLMPTLYVTLKDNSLRQVSLMGSGFQIITSISLLLMTTTDAIFLFDEIDASIHHSFLPEFWGHIAALANESNSQIFAVTHSKECVTAAVNGIANRGYIKDLNYLRLERSGEITNAVSYDGEELTDSINLGWEIR